ncbi:unnamed protein product [Brassicogethes aeneus]|uniref:Uncharacterized protein n=1 Tax=Brassicogethes aeneus TaxID=1431903 RepID=A0A9P0AR61_BRAAE|nr:unnamed protein product [Brassicogethes aeneus]
MVEPIFGVLGALAVGLAQPALPYALSFAAGAMIYVVMDDIIPEANTNKNMDLKEKYGHMLAKLKSDKENALALRKEKTRQKKIGNKNDFQSTICTNSSSGFKNNNIVPFTQSNSKTEDSVDIDNRSCYKYKCIAKTVCKKKDSRKKTKIIKRKIGKSKKKNKKFVTSETVREKTKERVRRHRAGLSEEEKEKKRERDREYRRAKRLKDPSFIDLSDREKIKLKKTWRDSKRKTRSRIRKEKLLENVLNEKTPPDSPESLRAESNDVIQMEICRTSFPIPKERALASPPGNQNNNTEIISRTSSSRKLCGRKKVSRERSQVFRKLIKTEEKLKEAELKLKNYKRQIDKYKKRYERMKNKVNSSENQVNIIDSPSPRTKVRQMLGNKPVFENIRKKLLLGEIVTSELTKKKKTSGKKRKQIIAELVSNKYFKKYRLLNAAKGLLDYNDRKNIASGKLFTSINKKKNTKLIREQENILRFLQDDRNSRMCPGKKDHKRNQQKRLLLMSMKDIFTKYKHQYKSTISYSSFLRLRPTWIVQPKLTDRDTCLCVKHANFEFLLHKMYQLKIIKSKKLDSVCSIFCCNIIDKSCMYRQCRECSNKKIDVSTDLLSTMHTVMQWKRISEIRQIKGKDKEVHRMVKGCNQISVKDMMVMFEKQLAPFLKHQFNMCHQYREIKQKIASLDHNETLLRIDFSENFVCKYHAEAQAMHFGASKVQLSLHTGVKYTKSFGNIKTTSFATSSDCLDHGAHAIWAHLNPILLKLNEFPEIDTIHFVSDGPSAQYKNRYNFSILTQKLSQICPYIIKCSWSFTEAGHGKGPMDGVGGVLKRTADKYICRGNDVATVYQFVTLLQKACPGIFLFQVKSSDIEEMKSFIKGKIPAIPKIMQLHQITWTKSEGNSIYLRELSCFKCDFNAVCLHHTLGKGKISFNNKASSSNYSQAFENNSPIVLTPVIIPNDSDNPNSVQRVGEDWIAVVYGYQWYPGVILKSLKEKLNVKFMARHGGCFIWPKKTDIQDIDKKKVLYYIKKPPFEIPGTAKNARFQFPESSIIDECLKNAFQN